MTDYQSISPASISPGDCEEDGLLPNDAADSNHQEVSNNKQETQKVVKKIATTTLLLFQIPILFLIVFFNGKYFQDFTTAISYLYVNINPAAIAVQIGGRLHIYLGTLCLLLGPLQLYLGFQKMAGTKLHKYVGYTYFASLSVMLMGAIVLLLARIVDTGEKPKLIVDYTVVFLYTGGSLWWGIYAITGRGGGDKHFRKVRHRAMMMCCYMGIFQYLLGRLVYIPFGIRHFVLLGTRESFLYVNGEPPSDEFLEEWWSTWENSAALGNILFYPSLIFLEYLIWHTPFEKIIRSE